MLWELTISALLEAIREGIAASELRVIFAGGIHDSRSAAMVSALAAPLAEQGVKIGVLMGTAYLFTKEAVGAGAVVQGFQDAAAGCRETVLLESGTGHITRCARSPFVESFRALRRGMLREGRPAEEIKDELENFNLGRLRMATKGIVRASANGHAGYESISSERQWAEGMYMIGQVAGLRNSVSSMRELHESVSAGGAALLRELTEIAPFRSGKPAAAPPPCDVAIVGMSCLLPQAPSLAEFWKNLIARKDAIVEIPAARFDSGLYYDRDRKAADKIYSRWGGFLDPVPFDPARYGIPPNALPSIDPVQLFSLVAVERALADSAYDRREFDRKRASVILGLSGGLGDVGIGYAVRSNLPLVSLGCSRRSLSAASAVDRGLVRGDSSQRRCRTRGQSFQPGRGEFRRRCGVRFLAGGRIPGHPRADRRIQRHGYRGRRRHCPEPLRVPVFQQVTSAFTDGPLPSV